MSKPRAKGWYGHCVPLCHFPKHPVTYPDSLKTLAIVCSSEDILSSPRVTPRTPLRSWYRPVKNSARVGAQTGCTKNCSSKAPSRARESTAGVEIVLFPTQEKSPQPASSASMTTIFGNRDSSARTGFPNTAVLLIKNMIDKNFRMKMIPYEKRGYVPYPFRRNFRNDL